MKFSFKKNSSLLEKKKRSIPLSKLPESSKDLRLNFSLKNSSLFEENVPCLRQEMLFEEDSTSKRINGAGGK